MNEFLRKFDTIRFVAPWSIFKNFLRIFHFLNSNLNSEFGPVWYRPKPEPDRTDLTSNRSNWTSSRWFCEPCWRLVSPGMEILCFYLMCRSSGTIHTRCIDSGCTLAPLSSYLAGSPVSEGPWTVTIWECLAKHLLGYCTTTVHSAATAEASATVAAVAAHIIGSSAGFHLSDVPVWRWYYQMVKNFV